MGPLGIPETIFIFVLALLLFGPKKLPELGRTLGKAMTEFRRASNDLKATFDREMSSIERETAELKQETQKYTNEIYNYDNYYDSGAYGVDEHHDQAALPESTVSAQSSNGSDQSLTTTENIPSSVSASATQGAESTASTTIQSTEVAVNGRGTVEHPDGAVENLDHKPAPEQVKS
jgi:TatA/E family protein of Tat protein translocase